MSEGEEKEGRGGPVGKSQSNEDMQGGRLQSGIEGMGKEKGVEEEEEDETGPKSRAAKTNGEKVEDSRRARTIRLGDACVWLGVPASDGGGVPAVSRIFFSTLSSSEFSHAFNGLRYR